MRTHETPTTATATAASPDPVRAAVERVVGVGPSFLDGTIDADHMANTMVDAVRTCAEDQRADATAPADPRMQLVLREIHGCGSGYLAGMCDGACVARTVTALVDEFGTATH